MSTRSAWLLSCLLLLLAGATSCEAGQNKVDPEKEEEALRQEIIDTMGKANSGRIPVKGKFSLLPEEVASAKPLPKVIGYISEGGGAYPVMVLNAAFLTVLSAYDKKEVTLMGKIIDKADKGKWLVADEIAAPPGAPVLRRKRGGL
ncbi:MAG TPA: hypothetical protein VEK08_02945 [Planctomycetota bacterium]|nr:hypothetical protein [Planctomycetota bacterium]